MRACYSFLPAAKAGDIPVLQVLEEIGLWGVQAKDFMNQLAAVAGDKLRVEISSPGGDVFAAVAMYNALRASGKEITTAVMGVAASAASLIMLAGDKREMPKNAMVMVHNPWSFAMGNAEELRETADTLDKIGNTVKATYVSRTGMKEADMTAMLSKDTWMTADEAKTNGFATEVIEEVKVSAKFDLAKAELPAAALAAYAAATTPKPKAAATPAPAPAVQTPEQIAAAALAAAAETDESPLADQVVVLAKAAGLEAVAGDLAINCATMDDAKARIASGRDIMAMCKIANKADLAPAMIRKNTPVAEVRSELVKVMAAADAASHTNGQRPNQAAEQSSSQSALAQGTTSQGLWAAHSKASQRGNRKTA